MNYFDFFKPYSPEIRGDLAKYLKEHNGMSSDNLFHGPEYFFIIKENGWMIPDLTWIRVNQSPAPDISYLVNSEFMLKGNGRGLYNMSCVSATKGVYDPSKVLKKRTWSILGLNLD